MPATIAVGQGVATERVGMHLRLRPGLGLTRGRRALARVLATPCPTAMVAGSDSIPSAPRPRLASHKIIHDYASYYLLKVILALLTTFL